MCDSGKVENDCHFLFECEHNAVRTSWEQDVIKNCTDFQNLYVASTLTFLFENLHRSSAKHVAKSLSVSLFVSNITEKRIN